MKRLSVLVETRLDLMAYNFADFLVKNLFDQIKKRNNVLLIKWLESATTVIINNIFDIYVNLLFKLKKDSILLYPTVRKNKMKVTLIDKSGLLDLNLFLIFFSLNYYQSMKFFVPLTVGLKEIRTMQMACLLSLSTDPIHYAKLGSNHCVQK